MELRALRRFRRSGGFGNAGGFGNGGADSKRRNKKKSPKQSTQINGGGFGKAGNGGGFGNAGNGGGFGKASNGGGFGKAVNGGGLGDAALKPDKDGWTPLDSASQKSHSAAVELLLAQNGVEVNQTNNNGWTPSHEQPKKSKNFASLYNCKIALFKIMRTSHSSGKFILKTYI